MDELELRRYLADVRIAGDVATPRGSNVSHAAKFAAGDPAYQFGLPPLREWSVAEVLGVMAERVGIDPDPDRIKGADFIDPGLTVAALARMRDRLAKAAAGRERVLLATGHPHALLEIHSAVALAFRLVGCPVLTPAAGISYAVDGPSEQAARLHIRYLGGVATPGGGPNLYHSHSPVGMRETLATLDADEMPDLVIADHGFAGAAVSAGLDVIGFADSNDPPLFIGEAEGRSVIAVPLDDGVGPHLYGPVIDFLLAGWADSPA